MNMLTSYEHAMAALSMALSSEQVDVVLKGRDDLNHVKLHAKHVRDRALLADATEFQMRVERWLGVLLVRAKDAGQLQRRARPRTASGKTAPVTLKEIGVDRKLSMKAQHAASLDQSAFDAAVSEMRANMAGGKAKLVSAINDAEKRVRRPPSRKRSGFDFLLLDGTRLGQVRLGKLAVRVRQLNIELRILTSISERFARGADALASVEDSVSEAVLDQIITSETY